MPKQELWPIPPPPRRSILSCLSSRRAAPVASTATPASMSQTGSVAPTIALAWAQVLSKPARLQSTEDHDGGAAQYDDPSVANAAKEVCFGIARFSAVAAERVVMKFGNQQSLLRLRTRSECEGRECERLAQGRAPAA